MCTESTPETKLDLSKLAIKPLEPSMDRAAFSCGNDKIDNFFRNNAKDHHLKHKARVYVAIYDGCAIGYYYLVAQSIPPGRVSQEAINKFGRVDSTPCVYLGMLGVQAEHQKNGVGKVLMLHAMARTLEVSDIIGIYALTLEAVDEEVAKRYSRWGFNYFIDGDLAMFLPIPSIRDALNSN